MPSFLVYSEVRHECIHFCNCFFGIYSNTWIYPKKPWKLWTCLINNCESRGCGIATKSYAQVFLINQAEVRNLCASRKKTLHGNAMAFGEYGSGIHSKVSEFKTILEFCSWHPDCLWWLVCIQWEPDAYKPAWPYSNQDPIKRYPGQIPWLRLSGQRWMGWLGACGCQQVCAGGLPWIYGHLMYLLEHASRTVTELAQGIF